MTEILKGAPVVESLSNKLIKDVELLKNKGITPTLLTLRVGERPDDLAYERGVLKKAELIGIKVILKVLPIDVDQETFDIALDEANNNSNVHGILMFRPLPSQLDNEKARKMLNPQKDIDGVTDGSLAGVFAGTNIGFPPCTAEAAMEILKYYNIPIAGKKACVIGRSLVIGRPVSMMLMHENATVSICHTKTINPAEIASEADILICAAGKLKSITKEYTNQNQVIIDVGINWDEEKEKIAGDVYFEEVEPNVKAITPVPGGVGTVTSTILISHVIEACKRSNKEI